MSRLGKSCVRGCVLAEMLGVPQDVKGRWWVDSQPVPVVEHAEVASDPTTMEGIATKNMLSSSQRLGAVVQ